MLEGFLFESKGEPLDFFAALVLRGFLFALCSRRFVSAAEGMLCLSAAAALPP